VACLKAGRRGIGIEIEPDYCRIAERRIAEARTPLFDSFTA
jgi:DNA modification methylase